MKLKFTDVGNGWTTYGVEVKKEKDEKGREKTSLILQTFNGGKVETSLTLPFVARHLHAICGAIKDTLNDGDEDDSSYANDYLVAP